MPIVECPECGEAAELTGRTVSDGLEITCGRCGHSWMRDSEPTCPRCGGRELQAFTEPLIQRARGNAHSIVGQKTIHLCTRCDAAEIERRLPSPKPGRAPREDPWK